jgi:trehalose 6-phosphate synthase/phosphatase
LSLVLQSFVLHTTPTDFPWYHTLNPITLPLSAKLPHDVSEGGAEGRPKSKFTYRYAIHRAGVFHRWENPSDGGPEQPHTADIAAESAQPSGEPGHEVPLHLMQSREIYTVNDVLGITGAPANIDHNRLPSHQGLQRAQTLHARHSSSDGALTISALRISANQGGVGAPVGAPRKKAVGFAPAPVPHHRSSGGSGSKSAPKQAVHLNSTDGLVVVSAFLPVILNRSDDGKWSAEWDYEMLLSMQTHLRVTRVGVVKWRGWHGNTQEKAGVPRNERRLVEECLLPFNCVPVWVDPILFGEMYNGFCKGVLWPVLHNVTSVYSNGPEDDNGVGASKATEVDGIEFSEYSLDDVEQGPIHGGRGREAELWAAYTAVNRQFAEKVVQCFHEGDLVWVHGFHLLILPSYLTRRIPMAKVGIFLHTPFPSSEIFRTLWCREDLLRGMLNADQVGFHLFEYARHFLTSCRRLLGLHYGMIPDASGGHTLAIDTAGRNVAVTSIHAGIEPPVLRQVLVHQSTMDRVSSIRTQFPDKIIFCGVDRLESLKGIPLKLLGFDRFLTRCPEWVGKIVLIQVGIKAFERGEDFHRTESETCALAQKINEKWPGSVHLQILHEREIRLQQRLALLRAADVCVVTSIRDGLNLLPLEFTIAHQDALTDLGRADGRKRGICILSEFSSSTRVMRGALHINPWKISEIASAFFQAANMQEEERLRRLSIASEFVTRVTTQRWALAVMLDLKGVHKNINPVQFSGAGLGLNYRLLGMDTGFTSLDSALVTRAYKKSKARLILLDYGGTIVSNDNVSYSYSVLFSVHHGTLLILQYLHFQLDSLTRFQMVKERDGKSVPTARMIDALRGLCEDKRNAVFVVSGKERHSLTKTLGDIPNLGLAAEHGMFISWPTPKTSSKRRWETLVPETDRTWRSLAVTIMEVYTSRTHGSYIEETEMKVLWQYRDADTEFGSLQAKELEDHLSKYLRSFPVDVLHGGLKEGGYVEVRPKGVNKGVLAMRVIKRFPDIAQKGMVDFALVLGDDHCDEPMLSVMRQIGRRVLEARPRPNQPLLPMPATLQLVDVSSCDNYVSPDLDIFTCTVGKKPSAAASYLNDVDSALELLEGLVKVSTRGNRFHSALDLASLPKMTSVGERSLSDGEVLGAPTMSKSFSMNTFSLGRQEEPVTNARNWMTGLALAPIEDPEEEDDIWF